MTPTNYQLNRRERMNNYLDSLKNEAITINGDESIIWLAKDFLTLLINKLEKQKKILEIPDCYPSYSAENDFHITFTWTKDEHYLECEILINGIIEFFYRNYLTKEVWNEEYFYSNSVYNESLLDKLLLFTQ